MKKIIIGIIAAVVLGLGYRFIVNPLLTPKVLDKPLSAYGDISGETIQPIEPIILYGDSTKSFYINEDLECFTSYGEIYHGLCRFPQNYEIDSIFMYEFTHPDEYIQSTITNDYYYSLTSQYTNYDYGSVSYSMFDTDSPSTVLYVSTDDSNCSYIANDDDKDYYHDLCTTKDEKNVDALAKQFYRFIQSIGLNEDQAFHIIEQKKDSITALQEKVNEAYDAQPPITRSESLELLEEDSWSIDTFNSFPCISEDYLNTYIAYDANSDSLLFFDSYFYRYQAEEDRVISRYNIQDKTFTSYTEDGTISFSAEDKNTSNSYSYTLGYNLEEVNNDFEYVLQHIPLTIDELKAVLIN